MALEEGIPGVCFTIFGMNVVRLRTLKRGSRRALQDRFKHCLGRTPMQEIHRCRVERLARLLAETNMTVGEIAAISGFEVDAHVARFFSQHAGMTPLEYHRTVRTPTFRKW